MEENKNSGQGTNKSNAGQNNSNQKDTKNTGAEQSNPFEGFDFSKLGGFDFKKFLDSINMNEIIKHLLSGGGAVAAVYFFFIKSLEGRIDLLEKNYNEQRNQIWDLKKKIRELEYSQRTLTEALNKEKEKNSQEEYFSLNRNRGSSGGGARVVRM